MIAVEFDFFDGINGTGDHEVWCVIRTGLPNIDEEGDEDGDGREWWEESDDEDSPSGDHNPFLNEPEGENPFLSESNPFLGDQLPEGDEGALKYVTLRACISTRIHTHKHRHTYKH